MKRFLFVVVFFIGAFQLKSQVLTLNEAVNLALKSSLDIQIVKNNLEAGQINNHISIAGGLPQVNGSLTNNQSLTNLNQKLNTGTHISRSGNTNTTLNAGLSGTYLIFNGFRVHATKNRLAAIEKQSEQQITVQIQNVIASVMVRYYDIVRQQSYMQTIQESMAVTLQRKEIVDARRSVGLANNADTYQAQLDLNASRQELQLQQLAYQQAKADLMNLLTQRPDSSFEIKDTIIIDSSINISSVTNNIRNNAEVLSAEQTIRINEWIAKELGSQRYPAIALNGGFNFARNQSGAGNVLLNQNYGPFLGVSLAVPIFTGGVYRRQQRVADINTKNAVVTRQMLINDLQTSAYRSWLAYQNSLEQLKLEKESNRIASDLLQLTLERFKLSQATIIEVREAQRSFIDAGYRLVNLSYSAKIAEVELKRLANSLGI